MHVPGLARWLNRSPAGSDGGVELTYHNPLVSGEDHLYSGTSSSQTTLSSGAQNPHRGCADLGGIRTLWKGMRRVVMMNKRTAALVWDSDSYRAVSYFADITKPWVPMLRSGTHFNS